MIALIVLGFHVLGLLSSIHAIMSTRTEQGGIALQLAGKYGLLVAMHGRFSGQMPPTDGLLGTLQQIGAAAAYGGGLIVQHMTAQTLAGTKEAQFLIDNTARRVAFDRDSLRGGQWHDRRQGLEGAEGSLSG